MNTPLIDSTEVGRRLGLSRSAVMHLVRQGKLPAIWLTPRVVRFDWEAIQQVMRERTTGKVAE